MTRLTTRPPAALAGTVTTGAAILARARFAALAGRRVGLITNHTGLVGGPAGAAHLVDLMHASGTHASGAVRLTAIFAPEHGFRGKAEAGAAVASARDARTGIPIHSLYGTTRTPTAAMLRDIDVLVFDIQDIGARFYTYISTMGLAMQQAARHGIAFVVLDRPNPLGGDDVSGFVLDSALASFVGQYPIPIVHGMTVGELARLIKAERMLAGLENLDLSVVACEGWSRGQRFPQTGLPWVATSPNIPTFDAALVYPGIGLVGETLVNEGRGTSTPFSQFGAPWLDAARLAGDLTAVRLPGVRFEATRYTPRAIPDVALNPRFLGEEIQAVRLHVTDIDRYRPLEVGIHALALLSRYAATSGRPLLPEKLGMFHAIAGTQRLHRLLMQGAAGSDIIAAWQGEVARFRALRQRHLLY